MRDVKFISCHKCVVGVEPRPGTGHAKCPNLKLQPRSLGDLSGEDLEGGAPLPEMTYGFLIQLVFCKNICGLLVLVTPFLSGAPPPKNNPGSAPACYIDFSNS